MNFKYYFSCFKKKGPPNENIKFKRIRLLPFYWKYTNIRKIEPYNYQKETT